MTIPTCPTCDQGLRCGHCRYGPEGGQGGWCALPDAKPRAVGPKTPACAAFAWRASVLGERTDAPCNGCREGLSGSAHHAETCRRAAPGAGDAGLREALGDALDAIVWMSGAEDFSPTGRAWQGWIEVRAKLAEWRALASPPGAPALAPWYEADGSTVMLPAEEVERRRKLAAKVLTLVRRWVREDEEAPGEIHWGHHIAEDGTDLGVETDTFAVEVDRILCEIERRAPPGSETASSPDAAKGRPT